MGDLQFEADSRSTASETDNDAPRHRGDLDDAAERVWLTTPEGSPAM